MSTMKVATGSSIERELPARIVTLIGIGLGVLALRFILTHPDSPIWWRVEVGIAALLSASVAYGGYWLTNSDFDTPDRWRILGWCLAGCLAAVVLVGGIYLHQRMEQLMLAEPAFLFDFLALVGATVGLVYGITRQTLADIRTREMTLFTSTSDVEPVWSVLSLLDGDSVTSIRQRWTILEYLVTARTREIPIESFIAILAREKYSAFPNDTETIKDSFERTHLQKLVEKGLVEIDEELRTVRYTGPESVGRQLRSGADSAAQ
ncbi:MAG: hypothetical protein ACQETB_07630 [Halobacteriota archaeon]